MRQIFLAFTFLLLGISTKAQFGISVGYKNFKAEEWTDLINTLSEKDFENAAGFNVGVDYWFRLKNIRIEFLPTASWSSLESNIDNSLLEMTLFGFHLNTSLYPFDIEGDCDCPTWSKSGGLFQKGFFIQASPGFVRNKIAVDDESVFIQDYESSYFETGIGAGLDIGISDLLTLTPLVRYHFAPNVEYTPTSNSIIHFGPTKSNLNQWFAGIRVGLRFDE